MGREVRRVPATWQHPKNERGHYRPLFDGAALAGRTAEWDEGAAKWAQGMRANYGAKGEADQWKSINADEKGTTYAEYAGARPDPADYMPAWPESERTHWQMYESTSEGTPISPVMDSPESLARWLADTGASAFAGMPATHDQWLATIKRGWAVSAMRVGAGPITSGVAGLATTERKPSA